MAKPELSSTNNVSNASSSWLLPIEQRISSVQKETEELRQSNRELDKIDRELEESNRELDKIDRELEESNRELEESIRELSEQLLQLRKQNAASYPEQQATALV